MSAKAARTLRGATIERSDTTIPTSRIAAAPPLPSRPSLRRTIPRSNQPNPPMGTWSTSIFGDDTASDIRADFREMIGDGLTPEAATQRLLADHADMAQFDPDA